MCHRGTSILNNTFDDINQNTVSSRSTQTNCMNYDTVFKWVSRAVSSADDQPLTTSAEKDHEHLQFLCKNRSFT